MDCGSTVDKSLRVGLRAKMWQNLRLGLARAKILRYIVGQDVARTVCGAGSDFQPAQGFSRYSVYCCKSA